MADQLIVPTRFRGPPLSGNGGYVAGSLAERFPWSPSAPPDAAVEVTLRAPTPLDVPLRLDCSGECTLRLLHGDMLIAEARPVQLTVDVPVPPSLEAARAAGARSPCLERRPDSVVPGALGFHPVCVCCGAELAEGEGLRVFAAPVPGFDGVAADWRPHPAFAGADGCLAERLIWTALDCPGQLAWLVGGVRTGLLGRMTARVLRPVPADADYLVVGWRQEVERRKHFAGTALFDSHGNVCAVSRQVWIGRVQ